MNDIEIEGLNELIQDLAKFGDGATRLMQPYVDKAATVVYNRVLSTTPVKSGELKKSTKLVKATVKNGIVMSKIQIGNRTAWYVAKVELGHIGKVHKQIFGMVRENPYLRKAADESKQEVADIMARGVEESLKVLGDKHE